MARRLGLGLLAAAAVAFAAVPSVAGHRSVTLADLVGFKVGVTTYAEVIGALGPPKSETFDSAGDHSIAYETERSRVKGVSFIPYAGIFLAGSKGTASMVVLSFGPDGRLIQYQSSSTTVDCSAALFGVNCKGGMFIPAPAVAPAAKPAESDAAPAPAAVAEAPTRAKAQQPATAPKRRCLVTSPTDPDAVTCN